VRSKRSGSRIKIQDPCKPTDTTPAVKSGPLLPRNRSDCYYSNQATGYLTSLPIIFCYAGSFWPSSLPFILSGYYLPFQCSHPVPFLSHLFSLIPSTFTEFRVFVIYPLSAPCNTSTVCIFPRPHVYSDWVLILWLECPSNSWSDWLKWPWRCQAILKRDRVEVTGLGFALAPVQFGFLSLQRTFTGFSWTVVKKCRPIVKISQHFKVEQ
jgi:hypothetical protein